MLLSSGLSNQRRITTLKNMFVLHR